MHKEAQAEPRTCYRCQRAQPLTEFYVEAEKRRAATLGRRTFTYPCRSCQSELAAERIAPRRAIVDAARAAGCTDCGLIDLEHPEIFDFDHLDGTTKAGNVAAFLSKGDLGAQVAVELSSRYLLAASFLGCIIAANYVTTRYGMVPVGFGLVATAGTYFAGASFVLRDSVQDTSGRRWVVALIVAGAILSFLIAAPFIALASAVAFLLSESADFAVYQPLRRRGYIRAAIASNIAGTLVDTFAFLWIAGFPIQRAFAGQLVGKLTITAVVVLGVVVVRAVSSEPLRPEGGAGHA